MPESANIRGFNAATLKLRLAIIQPTPFCNINCSYCYLPDRTSTRRMNAETMVHTFRFLLQHPSLVEDGFSIVWHSGEPMTLPIDFYRSAFSLLQDINVQGVPIQHRFSTNGMLIDQAWCDFINGSGLEVRISLDGPRWLHDANRRDRSGRGTFDRVLRGIDLLKRNDIPFLVNCVLTNQSLDAAREIWYFQRSIGARGLCFCVEEVLGANTKSSLATRKDIERLTEFFATLVELRDREDPGYFIREFDELTGELPSCGAISNEQAIPFRLVTIGWDGGISTFSPELLVARDERYGDFIFGNVRTHSLDEILASAKFQTIYESIAKGIAACKESCSYYSFCGGGGPAPKLFETGTFESTETVSCRTKFKAVVDAMARYRLLR
jgi:uncharacterized protein